MLNQLSAGLRKDNLVSKTSRVQGETLLMRKAFSTNTIYRLRSTTDHSISAPTHNFMQLNICKRHIGLMIVYSSFWARNPLVYIDILVIHKIKLHWNHFSKISQLLCRSKYYVHATPNDERSRWVISDSLLVRIVYMIYLMRYEPPKEMYREISKRNSWPVGLFFVWNSGNWCFREELVHLDHTLKISCFKAPIEKNLNLQEHGKSIICTELEVGLLPKRH